MNYKFLTKSDLKPEWKLWIINSVNRGVPKKKIFKILLNLRFDYNFVKKILEINYKEPEK